MLEHFLEYLDGQASSDWSKVLHSTSAHIARKPREEDDDEDDDENDKTPSDDDDDDDNDDEGYSE